MRHRAAQRERLADRAVSRVAFPVASVVSMLPVPSEIGVRALAAVLVILIAAIQTPLWFGKGGWLRVWELDQQLAQVRKSNEALRARNAALDAEVRDLKTGYDAIEERARSELGMIRQDEVFFQVLEPTPKP